jgi:hypothetical protein
MNARIPTRSWRAVALAAVLGVASTTHAQPSGADAPETEAADPAAEATGEPASAETAAVEDASPAAGDVAEDEEAEPAGWLRVDTDALDTQFWLGATHHVGGIAIASDIYVVGSTAELDVGPALSFGDLSLTPMVGLTFDFAGTRLATIVAPQLFTIFEKGALHFESWIQTFLGSPMSDGGEDLLYTRDFVLYELGKGVAVGPQAELSYRLADASDADGAMLPAGLTSLPVGGRVNLGYGKNNTLGIFLGYETQSSGDSEGIAGRFTFIRTW